MIKKFLVGKFIQTNCYVIFDEDTRDAIVVDPGDKDEKIVEYIKDNLLNVKYIYLTHCHFDHILGAEWLKDELNVPVACLDKEAENIKDENITLVNQITSNSVNFEVDKLFFEGDEIQIGKFNFRVIHTPGHTSGSSCLYSTGMLISGDTLFKGTYGRCDLPTGNLYDIVRSIKLKLFELPGDTTIYPGHGEETTIASEIQNEE